MSNRPRLTAGAATEVKQTAIDTAESTDLGAVAPVHGQSLLRRELQAHGLPMNQLTVLAPQNDPFRLDAEAGHRVGSWLADTARRVGLRDRTIHLRGLHCRILVESKPDGLPYTDTDKDCSGCSPRRRRRPAGSASSTSPR